MAGVLPGLGDAAVVPDVALVTEAFGHVPQLALFCVLLDGVEGSACVDLQFGVGLAGDLDHHVEGAGGRAERDVVEGRDEVAGLVLVVHLPGQGVPLTDFLGGVRHGVAVGELAAGAVLEEGAVLGGQAARVVAGPESSE